MTFTSNPGFLAVAFMEGSAAFILLVLYWLLVPGFRARFFRYWLAGWTVYVGLEGLRIYSLWRGGSNDPRFVPELALLAAALFFAAVLECLGLGKSLRYLWPLGGIAASLLIAMGSIPHVSHLQRDAESLVECLLYLSAGWLFWRSHEKHRGVGWKLLAGGLLLRGLHGLDRADWAAHSIGLFRVSFEGLFGIMMGIAMAVLVLEAGRVRTEDLNEKLRRLAMITAEASQSFKVDDALQGVLRHLVESLAASHGLVLLLDNPIRPTFLSVRASVGLSERFRKQGARISAAEPWAQSVLRRDTPFASYRDNVDATVQRWMEIGAVRLAGPGSHSRKTGSARDARNWLFRSAYF